MKGSIKKQMKPLTICFHSFTGSNPYLTSSLREHGDHELCTDPVDSGGSYVHKLEKRSFLPPVTCTKDHELGAVRAKVHCQPRPRLVRLPWPNDTSVHKVTKSYITLHESMLHLMTSSGIIQ